MAATTSGLVPGPYSISNLLRGEENTYESRISDLLSKRSNITTPTGHGAIYRLPDAALCRDLGVGTPTAGGNLVGAGVAAVAAAARPQLVLERAGAVRVEVNSVGAISLPVWQPDNGSAWLAEGATAPPLTTTVKSIECSGRMAAARLGLSRRMMTLAGDIEAAVLAEITASVAGTIEKGFISGTGSSNEPLGLINVPGRQNKAFTATSPSYSEVVDMLELFALADGNLSTATWLMHPSMAASLLKTELSSGSGQFLAVVNGQSRQPLLAGVPALMSRHVPAGKLILLDPAMVRTVFWSSPTVIVDKYSSGKSVSGAVEIVVLNITDLAVIQPAHIVVGSN